MDFDQTLQSFGFSPNTLIMFAIACGAFLIVYGVAQATTSRNPAAERMARQGRPQASRVDAPILKPRDSDASSRAGNIMVQDEAQMIAARRELALAGFRGSNAVRNFFLLRIVLAIVVPAFFLGLLSLSQSGSPFVPEPVRDFMNGLSSIKIMLILAVTCFFGYVTPGTWLDRRIADRRLRVELSFPNALDLMQISVEAGLAFDAAMTRVANEIYSVAPELSEEFLIAQSEIQAGKERQSALLAMANRTGVETVSSFVSVVLQSIQFGTPMGEALTSYAKEMRIFRELRALEKANKLPVQMSAVLASFMLPSIVMITLGPVVIRYINYFSS